MIGIRNVLKGVPPDVPGGGFLVHQVKLDPAVTHGQQVAIVTEAEERLAVDRTLAGQVIDLIVIFQMSLISIWGYHSDTQSNHQIAL